jgi:hypothetical protein
VIRINWSIACTGRATGALFLCFSFTSIHISNT